LGAAVDGDCGDEERGKNYASKGMKHLAVITRESRSAFRRRGSRLVKLVRSSPAT
jgi:hypothetical protein